MGFGNYRECPRPQGRSASVLLSSPPLQTTPTHAFNTCTDVLRIWFSPLFFLSTPSEHQASWEALYLMTSFLQTLSLIRSKYLMNLWIYEYSCSFPFLSLLDFLTILAQHFQSHFSVPQAPGCVTLSCRFSVPTWNWVRLMDHLVWISCGWYLRGSAPLLTSN